MKPAIVISFAFAASAALAGCGSTAPVRIGADTYYSAKTNTAGAFGDVSAVAGKLMAQGNQFCAKQGLQFELVTEHTNPSRTAASLGGADITFRCVRQASNPVMRKDNGVSTIQVH